MPTNNSEAEQQHGNTERELRRGSQTISRITDYVISKISSRIQSDPQSEKQALDTGYISDVGSISDAEPEPEPKREPARTFFGRSYRHNHDHLSDAHDNYPTASEWGEYLKQENREDAVVLRDLSKLPKRNKMPKRPSSDSTDDTREAKSAKKSRTPKIKR